MEDLRQTIAKNLVELRKRRGLTQLEIAEIFNYTDRAVSKWENGDTIPDIEVLYSLCEFYGVTLDYLIHEDNNRFIKKGDNSIKMANRISITALVVLVIWSLATTIFVWSIISSKSRTIWESFVWAIPLRAMTVTIFNHHYFHSRKIVFICWTIFIWSMLASIFVTALSYNLWPIFIIGLPAQASLIIWLLGMKSEQK